MILNRSEIQKLYEITQHFKDTDFFKLEQSNKSGIGTSTRVQFDLFEKNDTNIDITDVTNW